MTDREMLMNAATGAGIEDSVLSECLAVHDMLSLSRSLRTLSNETNPVARTAKAVEMFGRRGAMILPLIKENVNLTTAL